MDQLTQFDLALSYSSSDAWIAKDISDLIARYGYRVYCFDHQPDHTKGFLRQNLRSIYQNSRLNLVIWSAEYAEKTKDSLVSMERRCITNRHVEKGDAKSLFILSTDNTPIDIELEEVLVHELEKLGIVGTEKLILERLKHLATHTTVLGTVCHPAGTEYDRGQLHLCSFFIHDRYQTDRCRRWERLGDVEVYFPEGNPLGTRNVYLIPSGLTINLLGHTLILQSDREQLEMKRKATESFCTQYKKKEIKGFWFVMKKNKAEIATVYSEIYDVFLNEKFREYHK